MASVVQLVKASMRAEPIAGQKSQAVQYWSVVGLFAWALQCWIFWQWYAQGDMKWVPPGVTPQPQWMDMVQLANTIFWGLAIIATLWIFVLRPWMKTGKATLDGLFILAFASIWWQDALPNYNNLPFAYGTGKYQLNLGSWSCHIPGWQSPGGCLLAEPLLWDLSFYIVLSALAVVFGVRWLQSVKSRNPNITNGKMFLLYCLAIAVGDFIIEMSWVAMGLYHYGGMPNHLSILDETRFKFPLFEPVLIGGLFGVWAAFYYFRNDKGETLVERGLSQVNVNPASKQWLRFFALSGMINVVFFTCFSVPHIIINIQSDAWPQAIQERSYFTHGICGEGTPYPCGGKNIATPRREAINIGPDGSITAPAGASKPVLYPLKTIVD